MSNAKGCQFCRRYGLPVLPVRPAVMEKGDRLPTPPGSITVAVEGEADYAARLMRQGYLYILAERSQRWMNYYATGDGYFYPLPEGGSVPPRVESGEMKSGTLATEMAAQGMTFGGTVFSAYFQWMVLSYGLKNSGLPIEGKVATVFGANAGMAVASTAEALKLAMTPLISLELPSAMSVIRNGAMRIVGTVIWGWIGYGGGLIYAGAEVVSALDAWNNGKKDIGIAHAINALGVGMMTVGGGSKISFAILGRLGLSATMLGSSELAVFFLGPAGIFVGMLLALGEGARMLIHSRNNIQTWLLSTQLRQIPSGEDDIPAIYPNERMEKEGYMALTVQEDAHV